MYTNRLQQEDFLPPVYDEPGSNTSSWYPSTVASPDTASPRSPAIAAFREELLQRRNTPRLQQCSAGPLLASPEVAKLSAVDADMLLLQDKLSQYVDAPKGLDSGFKPKGQFTSGFVPGFGYINTEAKQQLVHKGWDTGGIVLVIAYLTAAAYYFYIRASKTLDIGLFGYSVTILVLEGVVSTSTVLYGLLLTRRTRVSGIGLPSVNDVNAPPSLINKVQFDLRVMVPCYKESLQIVESTLRGCLEAELPHNTTRTIYLCDDGGDAAKKELCGKLGSEVRYVTGRVRNGPEVNGKSNNLNNCLGLLYPAGVMIPLSEILFVMDADMVPKKTFFLKILEVMQDPNVALCLTPQGYHNIRSQNDIFNNINLSFWEYILPGMDAFEIVACTGTNFALRASALAHAGWFPTYTITEDYALGMRLKALGHKSVYLKEYLAIGEAPQQLRNICRQRSRWCKGQMQVLFSSNCPLLDRRLPVYARIFYFATCWSYITNMVAVPTAVAVPFLAMVIGILPFELNRHFAVAATIFLVMSTMVNLYCRKLSHVRLMWYATISNTLLWFTYSKAIINVLLTEIGMKALSSFKTTQKKPAATETGPAQQLPKRRGRKKKVVHRESAVESMEGSKDIYVIVLLLGINLTTLVVVLYKLGALGYKGYFIMMIGWSVHNLVPMALFLSYCLCKVDSPRLDDICQYCFHLSSLAGVAAIVGIWLVPPEYNFGEVLALGLTFFDAQKSGFLDGSNPIRWRSSSHYRDRYNSSISLAGGFYDGGDTIKSTYTTSLATTLLAWSYIEFGEAFISSRQERHIQQLIKWGTDYLVQCHVSSSVLVAQVGNVTLDHAYWGRPEDSLTMSRPVHLLNRVRPGSDAAASTVAAFAAGAMVFSKSEPEYASELLDRGEVLYDFALRYLGPYSTVIPTEGTYFSDSYYDDLAWASCWMYKASGNQTYLKQCQINHALHLQREDTRKTFGFGFTYDHVIAGVDVMLVQLTSKPEYTERANRFLTAWLQGDRVSYSKKGLAVLPGVEPTLPVTANTAMLMLITAQHDRSVRQRYGCWARAQIAYMLGDRGRSYLVGYGQHFPQKVVHRAASCPPPGEETCNWDTGYLNTGPNPHVLRGALVGGPNIKEEYQDIRSLSNIGNQVSLLNNAGFIVAIAGLKAQDITEAKCQQESSISV